MTAMHDDTAETSYVKPGIAAGVPTHYPLVGKETTLFVAIQEYNALQQTIHNLDDLCHVLSRTLQEPLRVQGAGGLSSDKFRLTLEMVLKACGDYRDQAATRAQWVGDAIRQTGYVIAQAAAARAKQQQQQQQTT